MTTWEELRRGLLEAIAQEHLLHQRLQELRRQVERWQARTALALRTGNEDMAELARQRRQRALRAAADYEEQCRLQSQAVRELKRALRLAPSPPGRQRWDAPAAHLEREERLERDLATLKASLAPLRSEEC
ncbi:MAG: PspA/IM30 family protein [Chloroflexota bacterium]|nr:PspA/IM30 family protein [Chloroflexota bacterium]